MQLREQQLRHVSIQSTRSQQRVCGLKAALCPRLLTGHAQRRVNQLSPPAAAPEAQAAVTTKPPAKEGWWMKDQAPNMKDVHSIQELVDELADAGDKLVIVEFYAPWCNACKALFPKICKMMAEHVDDVLFLKVSFEANKEMCKTMGIKVLPFFHLYRGAEGRVTQFSCTVSKIQRLKDALELYTAAFCSLEEPPGVEEFPEVHPHAADDVKLQLQPVSEVDQPTRLHTDYWQ